MKRTKIFINRLLLFFVIVAAIAMIGVFYFFKSSDAPLLKGELDYRIPFYKGLTLDLYQPTNNIHKKHPVVIFYHGGAWVGGRKESVNVNRFHGAINRLRDAGYVIISPDYTLASKEKSPFPDCIIDGVKALNWVKENADTYQLDTNNVGVFGESAGAHIALMVAMANQHQLAAKELTVNYVVDVYGPTDLNELNHSPTVDSIRAKIADYPEGIQSTLDLPRLLFGFDPIKHPHKAKKFALRFSPRRYLNSDMPPVLIIHGTGDLLVPISQSRNLALCLDSLKVSNEYHELDSMGHAFLPATQAQKDSVQLWISDFVMKQYSYQTHR